jgi:hypothetical protein
MYLRKGTTQEVKSEIEARGGVLVPSQASTPRDAAGTTPIRDIELFLEIGQ